MPVPLDISIPPAARKDEDPPGRELDEEARARRAFESLSRLGAVPGRPCGGRASVAAAPPLRRQGAGRGPAAFQAVRRSLPPRDGRDPGPLGRLAGEVETLAASADPERLRRARGLIHEMRRRLSEMSFSLGAAIGQAG